MDLHGVTAGALEVLLVQPRVELQVRQRFAETASVDMVCGHCLPAGHQPAADQATEALRSQLKKFKTRTRQGRA